MEIKRSVDRVFSLIALLTSMLALIVALSSSGWLSQPAVLADDEIQAGDEETVSAWQVFQDDVYGIRFSYPAGWVVRDETIGPGSVPIVRVLSFGPQDRKDGTEPISVEIGVGSLEELGSVWPGVAAVQTSIATPIGYRALFWRGHSGETVYVLEHPSESSLHIAFRESAGGVDGSGLIQEMVNSFEFTLIHPLYH